jgi:hypothetical protein
MQNTEPVKPRVANLWPLHSHGQQETVWRMKSVKPNSRSRITPPRAHDLSQNFAMCISFLAAKSCRNSGQYFIFICPLHFNAVNQKHYNMIICCHCTVRDKNPVKASVLTVNSAVILLLWQQLLFSIVFFSRDFKQILTKCLYTERTYWHVTWCSDYVTYSYLQNPQWPLHLQPFRSVVAVTHRFLTLGFNRERSSLWLRWQIHFWNYTAKPHFTQYRLSTINGFTIEKKRT